MNNFLNRQTSKLGTMAEEMVLQEFAGSKGYLAYPAPQVAHPFDAFCISGSSMFALEVKCKSRMTYRPETGIDTKDFNEYQSSPIPIYLLFVDPLAGEVYGQWMRKIARQPTHTWKDTTSFPLSAMTHYRYLTETEVNSLKELENSNYNK